MRTFWFIAVLSIRPRTVLYVNECAHFVGRYIDIRQQENL